MLETLTNGGACRHSFLICLNAGAQYTPLAELSEIVSVIPGSPGPYLTLAMAQAVLADMRAAHQIDLFGVNTGAIFEITGDVTQVYTGT